MTTIKRAAVAALAVAAVAAPAAPTATAAPAYKCASSTKDIDDSSYDGPWPDNWKVTVKTCAARSGSAVYAYAEVRWDGASCRLPVGHSRPTGPTPSVRTGPHLRHPLLPDGRPIPLRHPCGSVREVRRRTCGILPTWSGAHSYQASDRTAQRLPARAPPLRLMQGGGGP
ncbi:hypothetical protein ACFVJM_38945 [Streptomyces virginiae]|uniref:hypothetical protein n=1 Tax=Streptomyces virginiae TaxID=1961 RepID=UPI0036260F9C